MNFNNINFNQTQRHLTEEEKKEIIQVFEMFDIDKDNYLDIYQFGIAHRALGFELTKPELFSLSQNSSIFENGRIPLSKFKNYMENKLISRRPEEEISAAFKLFDIDNKGKVTVDNLKRIAQELGEDIAEDELEAMVLEFDLDGDRGINENEFFNIMRAAY